jgi:hypothetical protein
MTTVLNLPDPVYAGTALVTTITFEVPSPTLGSPTPTDPSTITVAYKVNNGTWTTYTYGVSTISRVSQGMYTATLDTTSLPGQWTIKWTGTGACKVVDISSVVVVNPPQ